MNKSLLLVFFIALCGVNAGAQSNPRILRTPEERFANLPGYAFRPHYVDLPFGKEKVRMHYVDEGRGPVVLLLHGEPSWSYLYRKMIPVFVQAGYRAIAPDLIGFGRSDKLARQEDYSYAGHVAWLTALLKQQKLRDITLVCQDWGGLIGLRVAAENPALFARIVAANTGLPTGDQPPSPAFNQWLTFSQRTPNFDIGQIIQRGSRSTLAPEIVAAYNAPFPDESYKAGARVFPRLVPIKPDDPAAPANRRAWEVLSQWKKPFLTAFSDGDAITRGGEQIMQQRIPGAQGQPHAIVKGAGHFLQEDKGEELANLIIAWMKSLK